MIGHFKTGLFCNFSLTFFNNFINKLFDFPTLKANDVIMVFAGIQFKQGSTIFESMSTDYTRLFKLG